MLLSGEVPKTIQLRDETLRQLNPDECTAVALLKKALALPATAEWALSTIGIFMRTGGLAEVLANLSDAKLILVRTAGVAAAFPVRRPSSRETTPA